MALLDDRGSAGGRLVARCRGQISKGLTSLVVPSLFVALVPPLDALGSLTEAVERLRYRVPELGWVAPSRWHVTLCFLGSAEPTEELRTRLARVAHRHQPPRLRVAGVGRFGDRVLLAKLDGDLKPLAAGVARAASRSGFETEDRPFRAHLTLARGRRNADLRPLVAELAGVNGPAWTAGELILMEGGHPEYQKLAAWPLTPSG